MKNRAREFSRARHFVLFLWFILLSDYFISRQMILEISARVSVPAGRKLPSS